MPFQPGDRFAGFEIIEVVARGASSTVYRAQPAAGSTTIALKIYAAATDDRTREARLLRQVDHPNVAEYVDTGHQDGRPWMATTWVDGRTLAHLLETEGPLSVDRSVRLVSQLGAAVDAIHDAGIVHGDLSPNNMVVDLHDQLTLLDLGEARDRGAQMQIETTDVSIATTPRYAAPEVAQGNDPIGASDRYAVALIAYEALTGRGPFPAVESPLAMLGHHASTAPEPPTEVLPTLPQHVDDALLGGLAKRPDDRPPTCRDLVAGLTGSSAPRKPRPAGFATAVIAGLLAAALIAAVLFVSRSDTAPNEWAAGDAAALGCNLITVPGFEQGALPRNYYDEDSAAVVRLTPGVGIARTTGVRVGAAGMYGLLGEIVAVTPNTRYVFSAWVQEQGVPSETSMFVTYLDTGFAVINESPAALTIETSSLRDDERPELTTTAPAAAAWAVPSFFKDGSDGSLLVDEVVFGVASECSSTPS